MPYLLGFHPTAASSWSACSRATAGGHRAARSRAAPTALLGHACGAIATRGGEHRVDRGGLRRDGTGPPPTTAASPRRPCAAAGARDRAGGRAAACPAAPCATRCWSGRPLVELHSAMSPRCCPPTGPRARGRRRRRSPPRPRSPASWCCPTAPRWPRSSIRRRRPTSGARRCSWRPRRRGRRAGEPGAAGGAGRAGGGRAAGAAGQARAVRRGRARQRRRRWEPPRDDAAAPGSASRCAGSPCVTVWLAIDDGRLDGRALWRDWRGRLPAPYDAAPLFLFGWRAWRARRRHAGRDGRRTRGRSDPGYSAADLLLAALSPRRGSAPAAAAAAPAQRRDAPGCRRRARLAASPVRARQRRGRPGCGSSESPVSAASTAAAQARPSAIAQTTSDAPRLASPQAYTPSALVRHWSSMATVPCPAACRRRARPAGPARRCRRSRRRAGRGRPGSSAREPGHRAELAPAVDAQDLDLFDEHRPHVRRCSSPTNSTTSRAQASCTPSSCAGELPRLLGADGHTGLTSPTRARGTRVVVEHGHR